MPLRVFIIISAILLPSLIVAFAVWVSRGDPVAATATAPVEMPRVIPETLKEAQTMARTRREELKTFSQEQWEQERLKILYRHPPYRVEDAVERADRRWRDLLAMTEDDWKAERLHLQQREDERLAARKKSEK